MFLAEHTCVAVMVGTLRVNTDQADASSDNVLNTYIQYLPLFCGHAHLNLFFMNIHAKLHAL